MTLVPRRILLAKPGLDGHDKGIRLVTKAIRDAGYEVIYLGLRQTPENIVRAAIDEDVDVIGLSILSGAHLSLTNRVMTLLKEQASEDRPHLIVGGTIPKEDIVKLERAGVSHVFPVGSNFTAIIEWLKGLEDGGDTFD
ncbi:MAG: cobalamin B12-binding domain-containing protein [Firmicutes bacterium]|nr:cobalamin B12-binding domain-containing protein [Bacillota bacterium]